MVPDQLIALFLVQNHLLVRIILSVKMNLEDAMKQINKTRNNKYKIAQKEIPDAIQCIIRAINPLMKLSAMNYCYLHIDQ